VYDANPPKSELPMPASDSFRDFERAGWSSASVVAAYHRHVAELTTGCIAELLRAARVKAADRVLDVACGAGYVAAAAHERGADAWGSIFPRRRSASQGRAIPASAS
jgi:2-polyprenyl-3-methyl-5-hydroxy-6-metoxy-1,4-benzoquinol methylase